MLDIYKDHKNLLYISVYFLISGTFYLYGFYDCGLKDQFLTMLIKAVLIPNLILLILPMIEWVMIKKVKIKYINNGFSWLINNIFWWIIPLYSLFSILISVYKTCSLLKGSYTILNPLIPIMGNICLITFVLYNDNEKFEEFPKEKLKLMHVRYLEYFRNYIWLVIFLVYGYYTWQLAKYTSEWVLKDANSRMQLLSVMSSPPHYSLSKLLLQVGVSCLAGIFCMVFVFTAKLKEIEKAMLRTRTLNCDCNSEIDYI